ncbi:hypothetical protein ACIRPK_20675 [Kitasatospora sp. NPDC101801]|uniref:hypothetical protein n=1 Tax=Kitasatospora sp. NPDC101801 TaxID=3364103 RepID=UPI003820EFE0
MSSLPQVGLSDHTDPTMNDSAVAPVLEFRTAPATSRTADFLAAGLSEEDIAEDRFAAMFTFLGLAVELGAVGNLDLGAVSPVGFESIVCALESEDVSHTGDIATVAIMTTKGRFAVSVRVDANGQVAA